MWWFRSKASDLREIVAEASRAMDDLSWVAAACAKTIHEHAHPHSKKPAVPTD